MEEERSESLTEEYQTKNAIKIFLTVRLWVIRFIVKRERAQTIS